jgi:hypothetical protein
VLSDIDRHPFPTEGYQKMTIKLASLKVDTKAETAGEWKEVNEWIGLVPDRPWEITKLPGLKFQVRSTNDMTYKVARQKASEDLEARKTAKEFAGDVVPSDVQAAAEGKVICDNLLLGWEGFDEPYSPELAADLLCSPDGRNIRDMVLVCAGKVGKREVEFLEGAAKN